MGFREVSRYHIICDGVLCSVAFTIFDDELEDETAAFEWEVDEPVYTSAMVQMLLNSGWKFIGSKLFCDECKMSDEEINLFAFLKADMGII